jgi:hypothetical protein
LCCCWFYTKRFDVCIHFWRRSHTGAISVVFTSSEVLQGVLLAQCANVHFTACASDAPGVDTTANGVHTYVCVTGYMRPWPGVELLAEHYDGLQQGAA